VTHAATDSKRGIQRSQARYYNNAEERITEKQCCVQGSGIFRASYAIRIDAFRKTLVSLRKRIAMLKLKNIYLTEKGTGNKNTN
jgi:ubiquinone biosynthesis protein UbiJ